MRALRPLSDLTNIQRSELTKNSISNVEVTPQPLSSVDIAISTPVPTPTAAAKPARYRHDPYHWNCLPPEVPPPVVIAPPQVDEMSDDRAPDAPQGPIVCAATIRHKCHSTEIVSTALLGVGQYVVIQGDRGIDIGVVGAVHREVPPNPSAVHFLRFASQREVDFWAMDLKSIEEIALECCRHKVLRFGLPMEICLAELQFDKKKLTLYYEASERVEFKQLNREMYREYGCRIWFAKLN